MAEKPAFVTQYEILRSQDYVLVTVSSPTGVVVDGRMQTEETQRLAMTVPRFLDFARSVGQIARNIDPAAMGQSPRPFSDVDEGRAPKSSHDDDTETQTRAPDDWVLRH